MAVTAVARSVVWRWLGLAAASVMGYVMLVIKLIVIWAVVDIVLALAFGMFISKGKRR